MDPPTTQTELESSNIPHDLQSISSKQQVALFFNYITDAFTASQPKASKFSMMGLHHHQWLVNWSKTSLLGSTGYSCKPDLVLIDSNASSHHKITWLSPKDITKYTKETFQPASQIGKTMDTKAYLSWWTNPRGTLSSGYPFPTVSFKCISMTTWAEQSPPLLTFMLTPTAFSLLFSLSLLAVKH